MKAHIARIAETKGKRQKNTLGLSGFVLGIIIGGINALLPSYRFQWWRGYPSEDSRTGHASIQGQAWLGFMGNRVQMGGEMIFKVELRPYQGQPAPFNPEAKPFNLAFVVTDNGFEFGPVGERAQEMADLFNRIWEHKI